jgi:hypothetical protein
MSEGRKLSSQDASRFVVPVGSWDKQNATFTLVSVKTGQRFTYRVRSPEKQSNPEKPILFVSLLTGSDNTNDYRYMGIIVNPLSPKFIRTKGSKIGTNAPSYKAFSWAFPRIIETSIPDSLEVWHEGRCCRCNRVLTVPESIESGIGPICGSREQ